MADLNANQQKAIEALLCCPTVAAAARRCGLSERTLWRYLETGTFKAKLRRRQDETITATAAALVGLSGQAIETLRDLLESEETPPSVKARVALGWLKEKRQTIELDDLAQRVAALEQAQGGK